MKWLDNLLDNAKKGSGIGSDRQLSLRLNRTVTVVQQWRVGRNKPNDEDIIQMAMMAGRDPQSTLIEWHTQSAPTPAAQSVWKDISRALKQTAAGLIFILPLSNADAGTLQQHSAKSSDSVYIMLNYV